MNSSKIWTVAIIGASISGLSAAIALANSLLSNQQRSVQIHIKLFERSHEAECTTSIKQRHGAGVVVEDNSVKCLEEFGLSEDQLVESISPMRIQEDRDRNGRIIRTALVPYFSAHWFEVRKMLYLRMKEIAEELEKLGKGDSLQVFFEADLQDYQVLESGRVCVKFSKNLEIEADVLVGADGSTSLVRQKLFYDGKEDYLRFSGYSAWRGVFDLQEASGDFLNLLFEKFPKNQLYFEMSEGSHLVLYYLGDKLNWLLYENSESNPEEYRPRSKVIGNITRSVNADDLAHLQSILHSRFQPVVQQVVAQTKYVFRNYIYDHDVLNSYHSGPVLLIGDAAHATTPHHVRGTNMALQDGFHLAKTLEEVFEAPEIDLWLSNFTKRRLAHCNWIVETARRLGKIKQGMYSSEQGKDWDKTVSRDQFVAWTQDKIVPIFEHLRNIQL
jgi:2-polyprenyl-6-methoxyphenol hydroxylase-like FAD-dependent oxidoreductase